MPLVLKGKAKRVIALSSGHGDLDLIRDISIKVSTPYAVSKAALNALIAKYDAAYRSEGVLFLSISPGIVDTGAFSERESTLQPPLIW